MSALLRVFASSWLMILSITGCRANEAEDTKTVVIYTSIDEPVATPILKDFEKKTGIKLDIRTDTEASKSVGLVERLRAEKDNPQADVFWENEPFLMIGLANDGVLQPYESPVAAQVPAQFKDSGHLWTGNAMRARKMIFADNGELPADLLADPSKLGLATLLDPRLKNRIGICRPSLGTAAGHMAAIWVQLGEQKATTYFKALHAQGVKLLGGNSVVAEQVGAGTLLAGITDNDDVDTALAAGMKVKGYLPDQESFGTLVLPCTTGLIKGAKHPTAAKQLIDYLLSAEVEQRMIDVKYAGYSVRKPNDVKPMKVDFNEVARVTPMVMQKATAIMEGRE